METKVFTSFATGAAISGALAWGFGRPGIFTNFVAHRCVDGISYAVDRAAGRTLSRETKIGLGIAIGTPIVWLAAEELGYPLGKIFFAVAALQGIQRYQMSQLKEY